MNQGVRFSQCLVLLVSFFVFFTANALWDLRCLPAFDKAFGIRNLALCNLFRILILLFYISLFHCPFLHLDSIPSISLFLNILLRNKQPQPIFVNIFRAFSLLAHKGIQLFGVSVLWKVVSETCRIDTIQL